MCGVNSPYGYYRGGAEGTAVSADAPPECARARAGIESNGDWRSRWVQFSIRAGNAAFSSPRLNVRREAEWK